MGIQQGKFVNGLSKGVIAVAAGVFLTSCATPKVVESVQPADAQLSCAQLQSQFDEAEKLRTAAEGSRNSSGGNLVMGALFFPGALLTHSNVNEAVKAAEARKTHLTALMNQKNCEAAKPAAAPKKPPAK